MTHEVRTHDGRVWKLVDLPWEVVIEMSSRLGPARWRVVDHGWEGPWLTWEQAVAEGLFVDTHFTAQRPVTT